MYSIYLISLGAGVCSLGALCKLHTVVELGLPNPHPVHGDNSTLGYGIIHTNVEQIIQNRDPKAYLENVRNPIADQLTIGLPDCCARQGEHLLHWFTKTAHSGQSVSSKIAERKSHSTDS